MTLKEKKDTLSKHRIEAFIDGIFAIAMTILVLNIEAPVDLDISRASDLIDALQKMIPLFFNYIISFVILGSIWINNNIQFRYINITNKSHLWLYLWTLMFVVLVPFSTSLMGNYPGLIVAELFFHLNLFCIGILSIIKWNYIIRNQYLLHLDKFSITDIKKDRVSSFVFLTIPIIASLVTFISPQWSTLAYVLIPIITYILRKMGKSKIDG